jgi:ADP-dependent NAD(P)H-hydrate dehydratase / NAD(P)H-hydrate epimerase
MKIVSAEEMREIDRVTSGRFGVPSLTLMENAGSSVADFVLKKYSSAQSIGVICGKGNNGGDGFVAARKLHDAGKNVRALLLADPSELRGDAAEMFGRLNVRAVIVRSSEELKTEQAQAVFESDVLLDAVLGTGFRPPVSELYAEAIAAMNASAAPVVAVDIPSGADADVMGKQAGVIGRADAVVTFTAPRPAHIFGNLTTGPIVVSPIGSPDEAVVSSLNLNVITAREVGPVIGPRPSDSNKGNFGHILVIGGSLGKSGSAAMAGFSALRVGAGLSTIATPVPVLSTVAGFHPELMTEPLEETEEGSIARSALQRIEELAKGKTVLAIGPGVSRNAETAECIRNLVTTTKTPIVLDADGLNAFEGLADELKGHNRQFVITPHPGEMARLAGCSIADVQRDRIKIARTFAADHDLIVVLKGHRTLVAKPNGEVWVNTTGNPGMATGGTGDILTGMVAGMIAQFSNSAFEAVIAAVHLHGLAGDVARESMGEQCMVATDLVSALPEAFRRARAAGGIASTVF